MRQLYPDHKLQNDPEAGSCLKLKEKIKSAQTEIKDFKNYSSY